MNPIYALIPSESETFNPDTLTGIGRSCYYDYFTMWVEIVSAAVLLILIMYGIGRMLDKAPDLIDKIPSKHMIDKTPKLKTSTALAWVADFVILFAILDFIGSIVLGVWLLGESLDTPRILGQSVGGVMTQPFCFGMAFIIQGVIVPPVVILFALLAKRFDRN